MLLAAVGLYVTARWVLVPYRVRGGSMLPTLVGIDDAQPSTVGDVVLVSRLAYVFGEPRRWDVAVVHHAEGGDSVKRIVGLPGERLEIREGKILIDARPLSLPDALGGVYVVSKERYGLDPVQLGADEFFLLGDSSYLSQDSRRWGPVHRGELSGRAVFVAYPWCRLGSIR
jgi:signal peptidase I